MCMCVYLNMLIQGTVSIMGEINDAGEREDMIDGEVSS